MLIGRHKDNLIHIKLTHCQLIRLHGTSLFKNGIQELGLRERGIILLKLEHMTIHLLVLRQAEVPPLALHLHGHIPQPVPPTSYIVLDLTPEDVLLLKTCPQGLIGVDAHCLEYGVSVPATRVE